MGSYLTFGTTVTNIRNNMHAGSGIQKAFNKWRPFLREGPEAKSYYREMNLHVLSQKGSYLSEYGSEI